MKQELNLKSHMKRHFQQDKSISYFSNIIIFILLQMEIMNRRNSLTLIRPRILFEKYLIEVAIIFYYQINNKISKAEVQLEIIDFF